MLPLNENTPIMKLNYILFSIYVKWDVKSKCLIPFYKTCSKVESLTTYYMKTNTNQKKKSMWIIDLHEKFSGKKMNERNHKWNQKLKLNNQVMLVWRISYLPNSLSKYEIRMNYFLPLKSHQSESLMTFCLPNWGITTIIIVLVQNHEYFTRCQVITCA